MRYRRNSIIKLAYAPNERYQEESERMLRQRLQYLKAMESWNCGSGSPAEVSMSGVVIILTEDKSMIRRDKGSIKIARDGILRSLHATGSYEAYGTWHTMTTQGNRTKGKKDWKQVRFFEQIQTCTISSAIAESER